MPDALDHAMRATPPRSRRLGAVAGLLIGLGAMGVIAVVRGPAPPVPTQARVVAPPVAPPVAPAAPLPSASPSVAPAGTPPAPFVITTATESEILAARPATLTVFRFAPNPAVVVLDFPTLHEQADALNRVAALIEKAGAPHDRVLTGAELRAAIAASGATPDTYYYGHDYRARDLAHFFALAGRDAVALTPGEQRLSALLTQLGWMTPDAAGALISLPGPPDGTPGTTAGAGATLDPATRAAILHHELSHGEYFTNLAYAAYVRRFWQTVMTAAERSAFRAFLAADGYDPGLEDLMMNEMQAYLMHTRNPRFFSAASVGWTPAQVAALQAAFVADMPPGWLRDCTPGPAGAHAGGAHSPGSPADAPAHHHHAASVRAPRRRTDGTMPARDRQAANDRRRIARQIKRLDRDRRFIPRR